MTSNSLSQLLRASQTVFTFREIALLWRETDFNAAKSRVNYYVRKAELYPLRRGIYAKDRQYDRLELATKIFTPAYVSLETVLQQEGVIFQSDRRIHVASYLTREIECDGSTFIFRKLRDSILVNPSGVEQKQFASVSKERAFMDALYLYKDYHFDNLSGIDWDVCFALLPVYGQKSMEKRLKSYCTLIDCAASRKTLDLTVNS